MNKYDSLVENLSKEFSEIPNFNLTQEEGIGKIIFNFLVQRIAEIHSLKTLFINYYLPAASKSVADDLVQIDKSKYKSLIKLSKEDLKENYYETVRLGFIAAYHKYENYLEGLIQKTELLIEEISDKNVPLSKYVKENFDFNLKDVKYSPRLNKISYVCNCNKHYDGYPRKKNKPVEFEKLSENEKFKFTKDDLSSEIDFLIGHYTSTLHAIFIFATHKVASESLINDLDTIPMGPEKEKILEHKNELDNSAIKIIELLKNI